MAFAICLQNGGLSLGRQFRRVYDKKWLGYYKSLWTRTSSRHLARQGSGWWVTGENVDTSLPNSPSNKLVWPAIIDTIRGLIAGITICRGKYLWLMLPVVLYSIWIGASALLCFDLDFQHLNKLWTFDSWKCNSYQISCFDEMQLN